jgi:magnesium-transporting ATPase (P-type)
VFAGVALPVTAGQILWINMVTSVTLALALAFEPAEAGIMRRPPRSPSEPLITPLLGLHIAIVSVMMVLVTFAVFQWELARGNSMETARTAAVNMLVVGELVCLFNVRHFTATAFRRTLFSANPAATAMALILVALQLLFTYAPPMQQIFQTTPLDAASWSLIAVLGLTKFLVMEFEKWLLRRRGVRSL